MFSRLFRRKQPQLVTNTYKSAPITVNHVRYVKQPLISPRAKAHAMAVSMGMSKQAEILK